MELVSFPSFELSDKEPLQLQIHARMVDWIATGRLSPGLRLPASRVMAVQLGVSRNTVVAVLDQLRAEGFITSHVGRGSFIAIDLPSQHVEMTLNDITDIHPPELSPFAQQLIGMNSRHHGLALPFTPGIPDLKHFPFAVWQKLYRRHSDRLTLMGYHQDQGYLPLRESLATYLSASRGVRCDAGQILITQGAQQAISLCSLLLLDEGDSLLHENPGYLGASRAFAVRSPHIIPVPLKDQVVDVDWIVDNSELTAKAKLMYSSPTHQYPMGGLLSASKRLNLLNWAQKHQVWVIEDDYDSEFHFLHKPVAAMQGMTARNNVIYMGSFSKTLFPSLRLGYLVLPKSLVSVFTAAKSYSTGESPLLEQAVIADFINEGHFVRHLRRMRLAYQQKWNHFDRLIQAQLTGVVTTIAESAGMHLVLDIPDIDDQALSFYLQEGGFGSTALSTYFLGAYKKTGLVLGFANTNTQQREDLVSLLKQYL